MTGQDPRDAPGHGRPGGVDDPVPDAEYGDDRDAARQAALDAVGDPDDQDDPDGSDDDEPRECVDWATQKFHPDYAGGRGL